MSEFPHWLAAAAAVGSGGPPAVASGDPEFWHLLGDGHRELELARIAVSDPSSADEGANRHTNDARRSNC